MTTPTNLSLAESLSLLSEDERTEILRELSPEHLAHLQYDWSFWGRPKQQTPEGDWRTWLILAGRGWGKTRTGGQWVRQQVESGRCKRIALVAPTAADARDTMVEGESGILRICPPDNMPVYEPSKRRLTWPNGAIATVFTADEPERLRGPQHDGAWCDEIASWRYTEAWDMLMFGLRLGDDPRVVVTTTPKATEFIRKLAKAETTVITTGTTYENRVNLAPAFFDQIVSKYEGTRLGRQELNAEILDDIPGALWTRQMIEESRAPMPGDFQRIVIGVDPAVTSGEDSDMTGIVAVGKASDGHAYVLRDLTCRLTPDGWGGAVVDLYHELKADRIIGEANNGGDMVELVIRTAAKSRGLAVSYKKVTASRGKRVRAEPVAALYEQHKVHHAGTFPEMEDQMVTFLPEGMEASPDRVDALVWALTELMLGNEIALDYLRHQLANRERIA